MNAFLELFLLSAMFNSAFSLPVKDVVNASVKGTPNGFNISLSGDSNISKKDLAESVRVAITARTDGTGIVAEVGQNFSIEQRFYNYLGFIKGEFQKYGNKAKNWLEVNNFIIGTSIISSAYIFTFCKLSILKNSINKQANWSQWNPELNFETLSSLPKDRLINQMIKDIEKKYYKQENPNCYINPFNLFNNDVENEIGDLKSFLDIACKIKSLRLQRIYFLSDTDILNAQNKIKKLSYIKNLFLAWKCNHKGI